MRNGLLALSVSLGALGLAACSGGGGAATSSSVAASSSTSFRTIPTTATTLSPSVPEGDTSGTGIGADQYTIQSGDFPLKIVSLFQCESWEQIANYNEIDASTNKFPFPGTVISIPAVCGQSQTSTETTAAGSTGDSTDSGTTTTAASGDPVYVVVAGDTVYGIAAKLDVSPTELATFNGWSDGVNHSIFPGMEIKIP
ncbi:MAG: LysM peptidoglycan-binding domain-containing protein [Ilumatobacteraceae bacterium]